MLESLKFDFDFEVIEANNSKEAKAGNASPGKPAILIK